MEKFCALALKKMRKSSADGGDGHKEPSRARLTIKDKWGPTARDLVFVSGIGANDAPLRPLFAPN